MYKQGRRHSFESGGQIMRAKRTQIFLIPTFGQWGTKYRLDSYGSLIRQTKEDTALTLV